MPLRWLLLLLLLVWLAAGATREQWSRHRQMRLLQNRCSEPECAASIRVFVRAYCDVEAATTVRLLLSRAYCPFRVYVGVVEDGDSDTVGALIPPHPTLVDHVHSRRPGTDAIHGQGGRKVTRKRPTATCDVVFPATRPDVEASRG